MAAGKLRGVVCTSSLDLGVDWGDVDLVINIGAPKGASRLMQRIGRANHRIDEASRACWFRPTASRCWNARSRSTRSTKTPRTPRRCAPARWTCWRSTCSAAPAASRFCPMVAARAAAAAAAAAVSACSTRLLVTYTLGLFDAPRHPARSVSNEAAGRAGRAERASLAERGPELTDATPEPVPPRASERSAPRPASRGEPARCTPRVAGEYPTFPLCRASTHVRSFASTSSDSGRLSRAYNWHARRKASREAGCRRSAFHPPVVRAPLHEASAESLDRR